MSNTIGKVGDIVEWDFKDETFDKYPSWLKDNVFTAEVAMVDLDEKHYGVYADYGQDFIPFDSGRIIKVSNSKQNVMKVDWFRVIMVIVVLSFGVGLMVFCI